MGQTQARTHPTKLELPVFVKKMSPTDLRSFGAVTPISLYEIQSQPNEVALCLEKSSKEEAATLYPSCVGCV